VGQAGEQEGAEEDGACTGGRYSDGHVVARARRLRRQFAWRLPPSCLLCTACAVCIQSAFTHTASLPTYHKIHGSTNPAFLHSV
jgi:hypothetical protein